MPENEQKHMGQLMSELQARLRKALREAPVSSENMDGMAMPDFGDVQRKRLADNLVYVVESMLMRYLAPPTSRRGQGEDGGRIVLPGDRFEL